MVNKYKQAWEDLKISVKGSLEYYKKGEMCSIHESIEGEARMRELLNKINRLEEKYKLNERENRDEQSI